jgi:uncharacterized protein (DUF1778 family)
MKAITLRMGPETYRIIERRAKAFHRSLSQQVLFDALQMAEMDAFANSTLRAPERRLSRTAPSAGGSQRDSKRGGGES